MKTQFYILLTMKSPAGFETYGQYFLGNKLEAAYAVFDELKGDLQLADHCLLHIDLMETVDELPVKIKSICCTLDEISFNCKKIAKEIFLIKNLKELNI